MKVKYSINMRKLTILLFLKSRDYSKRNKKSICIMRMFYSFLFLTLTFFSHSQESDSIKSKKFYLVTSFSPDYCYRSLTKNDKTLSENSWLFAKNIEDSIDIAKISFSTGIMFGYELNNKFAIELGVHYSNKGWKTIPVWTIYDWNKDPERATIIYNFKFIDIPLKLKYCLYSNKKIQSSIGLGIVMNFLVETSAHVIPEKPTLSFREKTYVMDYPYNKVYFSPTLNLGFAYKLSPRVNFTFEPTFRYSLTIIDEKAYKGTHLWNIGLNIGVKTYLK